ncbi:MAG TPA: ski2-like helicase, partial [Thermoplasmata archaeon]|nr:ski2-like helicase [Thermoplasmata archaeon]
LAAGINLPARRVIVRDLTRYDDRVGMQTPIPTLEVQQMCGRAGRPGLDPSGEAVLLARSDEQVETYLDEYLSAPPEDVRSQLGSEPALRTHLLALVASGAVSNERELERFFEATFYGHTRPVVELDATVRTVRSFLEAHGFLEREERLRATPFGALTSELYLDPLSAVVLRQAVEKAPIGVGEFALLSAVAATPDLPPLFLRRGEERELLDRFVEEEPELLVKPEEEPLRIDLDGFLSTLKTASVLEAWVRETPIVELTDRFGIGAGDLKAKVEDAEWLLFGALRIAQRFQRRSARALDALSLRVRYGVREELLDLVRLRGIGRVRGRALHAAGLTDREAVRAASPGALERVLRSPALVESVRVQVGAAPPIGRRREARTTPSRPTPSAPAVTPARSAPRSRRLEDYPAEP